MADPFFAKKSIKRKRGQEREEEEESVQEEGIDYESDDDFNKESTAQKRLRLAKNYLSTLQDSNQSDFFDAKEIDRELISKRLEKDVLASTGKIYLHPSLLPPSVILRTATKSNHRTSCTAAVASSDGKHLYTAGKDGKVVKWALDKAVKSGKNIQAIVTVHKHVPRTTKAVDGSTLHTGQIWSLALSEDGKHLASGGSDRVLGCWDVSGLKLEWRKGLKGHKDGLASLAFRQGTSQLFTSSYDRTVKLYDMTALSYIDTLFGHQEKILSLAALRGTNALTAGGMDKSLRLWKVNDDSQLVFRGGGQPKIRDVLEGDKAADDDSVDGAKRRWMENSVECCAMVDDTHFVSGGDTGTIALWTSTKKKPVYALPYAHGFFKPNSDSTVLGQPRWIMAIATLPYSDIFATGSWDGKIRVWKINEDLRTFKRLLTIPVHGIVNSLQLLQPSASKDQDVSSDVLLVAAVGQEHRLGRWITAKEQTRNEAIVAILPADKSV